jgi:hypothetical protein
MDILTHIRKINASISAKIAENGLLCLENIRLMELAEPVVRNEDAEEWIPAVVENSGEDTTVFADDEYPLGVYHRLLSKAYATVPNKGYGDSVRIMTIADMKLVCWGFRNTLNTTADRIESFIYATLPADVLPVRSIFDRAAVFGAEFKGIEFFLPEEVFLFSMDYKLQYPVNKRDCIDLRNICNN